MKWILSAALAGWCGIIALGWHLANERIDDCNYRYPSCEVREAATRDALLIFGLIVALVLAVILARLVLIERQRLNGISAPSDVRKAEPPERGPPPAMIALSRLSGQAAKPELGPDKPHLPNMSDRAAEKAVQNLVITDGLIQPVGAPPTPKWVVCLMFWAAGTLASIPIQDAIASWPVDGLVYAMLPIGITIASSGQSRPSRNWPIITFIVVVYLSYVGAGIAPPYRD